MWFILDVLGIVLLHRYVVKHNAFCGLIINISSRKYSYMTKCERGRWFSFKLLFLFAFIRDCWPQVIQITKSSVSDSERVSQTAVRLNGDQTMIWDLVPRISCRSPERQTLLMSSRCPHLKLCSDFRFCIQFLSRVQLSLQVLQIYAIDFIYNPDGNLS